MKGGEYKCRKFSSWAGVGEAVEEGEGAFGAVGV
jgi:hypothetical protein